MSEDKGQPTVRKKLTEKDKEALMKILDNMTLTPSGMLRIMAYLVENPEMADRVRDIISELVRTRKTIEKNTEAILQIPQEMAELRKIVTSLNTTVSKAIQNN